MASQQLPRRLAGISYADATQRDLSAYLDSASPPSPRGAVVYYAGEVVLAEFDVVADALRCAVTMQRDIIDAARDKLREFPDLVPVLKYRAVSRSLN